MSETIGSLSNQEVQSYIVRPYRQYIVPIIVTIACGVFFAIESFTWYQAQNWHNMISAIIICFFVIALCIYLLIGFCAKVIITNESIRLRNKPFFKLQEVNLEYVQAIYVVSDWRGHTHIIFSHECLDAERCQKLANRCGLGMFLIIQQKVVFPITTGDIQGVLEILNNCFPIVYVP